jgi:hypothetical protein
MFDPGVPRWQTQGIGGYFQTGLGVVTVGGIDDVFQFLLLLGQLVKISIRFGIGCVYCIKLNLGIFKTAERLFDYLTYGLAVIQLRFLR